MMKKTKKKKESVERKGGTTSSRDENCRAPSPPKNARNEMYRKVKTMAVSGLLGNSESPDPWSTRNENYEGGAPAAPSTVFCICCICLPTISWTSRNLATQRSMQTDSPLVSSGDSLKTWFTHLSWQDCVSLLKRSVMASSSTSLAINSLDAMSAG